MGGSEEANRLEQAGAGDPDAFCALFDDCRYRLRRMIELRLTGGFGGRIDASDVLQETYLDAARRLPAYLRDRRVPVYVWLRGLAYDRLLRLQRRHVHAKCRAVNRQARLPAETSVILARRVMGSVTTPSRALSRRELREHVQQSIQKLKEEDREILLMRHFEEMSNRETACALGLSDSAAAMRYGRALFRLRQLLLREGMNGDST